MSIHYLPCRNEKPFSLTVEKPSRQATWEVWDHETRKWEPLGENKTKVTIGGYPLSIDPTSSTAIRYLEHILPDGDGHHVLVAYQWLSEDKICIGIVRSDVEFKGGHRTPPKWAQV